MANGTTFDKRVTLGNILTIVAMVASVMGVYVAIRVQLEIQAIKLSLLSSTVQRTEGKVDDMNEIVTILWERANKPPRRAK